jgi:L-alanine-DL-glutamate epimerase-like enolase superfamily enzyme
MPKLIRASIYCVDLEPPVRRTDAIQGFERQETPIVTLTDSDGITGTGYTYTIGTGGRAIVSLLEEHLLPALRGADADDVESIWRTLWFRIHAHCVGATASLAIAAIDTALWDLRSRRAALPLHLAAGGAAHARPVYSTEGGWLHLDDDVLVAEAVAARDSGFLGAKIKVGKQLISQDVRRLAAVRDAVGSDFEIMVDGNQGFALDQAVRLARELETLGVAWFEEPLPADDVGGHTALASHTSVPIAVGESLYSLTQFGEYLRRDAASLVQVDAARVGGITPWLKVAHLAEAFNVAVCPHFLMELHVSTTAAVPNGRWVEYIPQLDLITDAGVTIVDGHVIAPTQPGLGIEWDWERIDALQARPRVDVDLSQALV